MDLTAKFTDADNAQNIEGAKLDTIETVKELDTGKEKMQDEAIHQTTEGVNQISNVVQTNSATAQQTAAASEELSGQANVLRKLMSKFQLQTAETALGSKEKRKGHRKDALSCVLFLCANVLVTKRDFLWRGLCGNG